MKRTLYLAAYDVRSASRLRKALRILRDYSTGGQKSVFECFLSAREKQELFSRIESELDMDTDSFLLVQLQTRKPTMTMGIAIAPVDPDFFYVG